MVFKEKPPEKEQKNIPENAEDPQELERLVKLLQEADSRYVNNPDAARAIARVTLYDRKQKAAKAAAPTLEQATENIKKSIEKEEIFHPGGKDYAPGDPAQ